MKYLLIEWPESQNYMEYDWFRSECYLAQAMEEDEHMDSAYFIPENRYNEVNESMKG